MRRFCSQQSWYRCLLRRSAGLRQPSRLIATAGCQGAKFHKSAQPRVCSREADRVLTGVNRRGVLVTIAGTPNGGGDRRGGRRRGW
jgi:hypothetical protein